MDTGFFFYLQCIYQYVGRYYEYSMYKCKHYVWILDIMTVCIFDLLSANFGAALAKPIKEPKVLIELTRSL